MKPVKPFLKWVGGKSQILEEVLAHFPKRIKNYYEPFLGGGSVLLAILDRFEIKGQVYASDTNYILIDVYKHVQQQPDTLIKELYKLTNEYDSYTDMQSKEAYYYRAREIYNEVKMKSSVRRSAMFIFLNKTCFRGLYRESTKGFNVPFGHYKKVSVFNKDHIMKVSALIRNVVFMACSFEDALKTTERGDFVYIDPPYVPETKTSFVSYTLTGFDVNKHKALFKLCEDITRRNVAFVMSNSDTEFVRTTFSEDKYKIVLISCRRRINSKRPSATTNELLVVATCDG